MMPNIPRRPYGDRYKTVGNVLDDAASPARGAHLSASSTVPSGIGTRRSRWTTRSRVIGGGALSTRSMRWLIGFTAPRYVLVAGEHRLARHGRPDLGRVVPRRHPVHGRREIATRAD